MASEQDFGTNPTIQNLKMALVELGINAREVAGMTEWADFKGYLDKRVDKESLLDRLMFFSLAAQNPKSIFHVSYLGFSATESLEHLELVNNGGRYMILLATLDNVPNLSERVATRLIKDRETALVAKMLRSEKVTPGFVADALVQQKDITTAVRLYKEFFIQLDVVKKIAESIPTKRVIGDVARFLASDTPEVVSWATQIIEKRRDAFSAIRLAADLPHLSQWAADLALDQEDANCALFMYECSQGSHSCSDKAAQAFSQLMPKARVELAAVKLGDDKTAGTLVKKHFSDESVLLNCLNNTGFYEERLDMRKVSDSERPLFSTQTSETKEAVPVPPTAKP